ncbi:MAG: hypothetical protein V4474_03440 [Patescibacteria group bacterium]
MSQIGPYVITDQEKWPRTLIKEAGQFFPTEDTGERELEVTFARFTEGTHDERTRISQIDWWAQSGGYRPLLPRELFAAARYNAFAHQVLGGTAMPAMRVASSYRFAIGENPGRPPLTMGCYPPVDGGYFAVYWGDGKDARKLPKLAICLDPIGPNDSCAAGPFWWAFTKDT